jgi:hypothetical protein
VKVSGLACPINPFFRPQHRRNRYHLSEEKIILCVAAELWRIKPGKKQNQ